MNGAIDSATVDFSRGALQLIVSETERAVKDEQDKLVQSCLLEDETHVMHFERQQTMSKCITLFFALYLTV